jgi:glycosyltransferase involved in cell wall biosynthesis
MTLASTCQRGLVSIVISSFNYERFLGAAISSALEQDHQPTELIVVDDGSTDHSRRVIAAFGEHLTAIFKTNAGQASALNAGFHRSRGEVVIFLDSDDLLMPGAAAAAWRALGSGEIAKAHWSMPIIDGEGRRTGTIQDAELAEGDLRRYAVEEGPLSEMTMPSPPMSGNAFARWYLDRVMPIPEQAYVTRPDEYLFGLAPSFGPIARLPAQSLYRIHGANTHGEQSFEWLLAFQERHHAILTAIAAQAFRREHLAHDEQAWAKSSWWLRAGRVARAIEQTVPAGGRVALIDQGALGVDADLRGRLVTPFPNDDGRFAGAPADDRAALRELDRMTASGDAHVALAWPAFWWLEEYPRLAARLRSRRVLAQDQDLVIFAAAES